MFFLILSGSLYFVYRLGVYIEQRHKERCYICAGEIDLMPRDWKRESHYWDSTSKRWAHLPCKVDEIERYRRAGGL